MTDQPPTEATRLSAEREQEIREYADDPDVYAPPMWDLLAELDYVRAENARLTESLAATQEGRQKYWLLWREMIGVAQRSYELFRGAVGSAKQAEAALAESRHEVERLRKILVPPNGVCRLCKGIVDPEFGGHHDTCALAQHATPAAATETGPAPDLIGSLRRQVKALPPDAEGFTWTLARVKAIERPGLVIEDEPVPDEGARGGRLEGLLTAVAQWGRETFPASEDRSKILHLQEEVGELAERPWCGEEMADVVMIVAHLAAAHEVNLADEIERKLALCRQRVWGNPDENGVVKAIKKAPGEEPPASSEAQRGDSSGWAGNGTSANPFRRVEPSAAGPGDDDGGAG